MIDLNTQMKSQASHVTTFNKIILNETIRVFHKINKAFKLRKVVVL